jgi:hypothetical protein
MPSFRRTRGRRSPTILPSGGERFESLEARTHLNAAAFSLPELTWTGSQAVAVSPNFHTRSSLGDATLWPTDVTHQLINLDDFYADPRFSGIDGTGYSAVVIDTGIDLDDPFFGIDKNRNGVSDRIVYSYDFADGDSDASDVDGHGSNVSSILAGDDAAYGGVVPAASLIHLKVFPDDGGGASFAAIEKALRWVISNAARFNIASVNMSLGDGGNYQSYQQAYGISDELARLAAMNVLVCAAAGNSFGEFGSVQGLGYPAADPNVLAVGAVYDRNMGVAQKYGNGVRATRTGPDRITPFSQRTASMWEIFAVGDPATGAGPQDELIKEQGTSQASPQVTGVALLMQQLADRILGRRLTLAEFRDLAWRSGKRIVDGDDERDSVQNTGATYRRLDVAAMAEAMWQMAGPEARVLLATATIIDGTAKVAFGSTSLGTSVTKTFTVQNDGAKLLKLSRLIAPSGFSVVAGLGDRTLEPGESTTFTIQLDGAAVGDSSGEVRLTTNDLDERLYSFQVSGATRAFSATLDDGSSGATVTGTWTTGHGGAASDFRVREAADDAGAATWSFKNLLPGRYRISTTWVAGADLASRARYSVSDGEDTNLTKIINQRVAPNDFAIGAVTWEDLGTYTIDSSELSVELGGVANGRLMADAVRIERVGTVPGGSRLFVALGGVALDADTGEQKFGTTTSGRPVSRSLIIRNVGDETLTLDEQMWIPDGFTVTPGASRTLKPGTSTTLTILMQAGAPAEYAGTVVLFCDDPARGEFGINISGKVVPLIKIIDDGDTGFSTVGGWTLTRPGYRTDARTTAPGGGAGMATWNFTKLTAGLYRVMATWGGGTDLDLTRAEYVNYTIDSGDGTVHSVHEDQRVRPTGEQFQNAWWKDLGHFRVTGDTLVVRLNDSGSGLITADGIRIERIDN